MAVKKFVCIHGHFYQPPRENPWLEYIEPQESAAPFHDWNERVNAECYAPNTAARIIDSNSWITKIINNYEYISFNFGPTLLDWLAEADPDTVDMIRAADAKSLRRLGYGNAIAQNYNHIIMPLASRHDKITQIRWGIKNFEHHFGRPPQGMWLAETAVDLDTLDLLAREGILFTVLAPRQAAAVRPHHTAPWQDVLHSRIDPRRPYYAVLPGGGKMALFFYDGPLSQSIAFEGILNDGQAFAARIKNLFDPHPSDPQLVHMATDGESYGHHHRFGEMALAYALHLLNQDPEVTITNYAGYLAANPPTWEVQIIDNSSWSCVHGVERWRSDCGCGGRGKDWSLAWRSFLRQGLDELRDDVVRLMETKGRELLKDPWAARDDYINFLLAPNGEEAIYDFLARHQAGPLDPNQADTAMKLMSCARFAMYMFTSCGWFFEDISGLEAVQNMNYAARCIDLANSIDKKSKRLERLLRTLEKAESNFPTQGSGRDIWRRYVEETWPADAAQVLAEALLPVSINGQNPPSRFHCYVMKTKWWQQRRNLNILLSLGAVEGRHIHLLNSKTMSVALLYVPDESTLTMVGPWRGGQDLTSLWEQLTAPLQRVDIKQLKKILLGLAGWRPLNLVDFSFESRHDLATALLGNVINRYRQSVAEVYSEGQEAMHMLREINLPLPNIFSSLAEAIIADQAMNILQNITPSMPLPSILNRLAMQARALGIKINDPHLKRMLESILERESKYLYSEPGHYQSHLERLNSLLTLAQAFSIEADLWRVQNNFYLMTGIMERGYAQDIIEMGKHLGFAPEIFR
ncbi:MAG: DUF3536 domain-containing protein [Desulfarculales bacterium]|jgi:alpha-amylase/alpha-mannosidase (GH57 family)|nr:DUF3536 domain-containing protein [Desulfarculales bacterium]